LILQQQQQQQQQSWPAEAAVLFAALHNCAIACGMLLVFSVHFSFHMPGVALFSTTTSPALKLSSVPCRN
jgi:hypothetical protein